MRSVVYHNFGLPEQLKIEETDKPNPKPDEVLIKVMASSINSWDGDLLRGKPFLVRMIGGGIQVPKIKTLGCDIAGVVESVGENVTTFEAGDEVFGDTSGGSWGGFADYATINEGMAAKKPPEIPFVEAASLPQAGVLALQGIQKRELLPGEKVLINGAGGGVGTIALQMAKNLGAEVTCVDTKGKLEKLRSLGADHVVDFNKEDFTTLGTTYDLIIDNMACHKLKEYYRVLNDNSKCVIIGGCYGKILINVILNPLSSREKHVGVLAHKPNSQDLNFLATEVINGNITPVVDKTYGLESIAEAFQYYYEGDFVGKIVITN